MKRFYLLLLSALSAFHVSSQSHFITAGQTQGMTVTDYVPDVLSFPVYGNQISTYDYEDINGDGLNDIVIYAFVDQQHSIFNAYVHPLSTSIQLKSQIFYSGNQINNDTANWTTSYFYFSSYTTWADSSYYLGGRYFTPNDTLLFYVHSGYNHSSLPALNFIKDYAIEGPDSTIIISSTNNLSPSDISISPNPFTSFINITSDKAFQYNISDYLGRVVLSGESDKTIVTEPLASGNYILTIKNEETFSVRKMVKY